MNHTLTFTRKVVQASFLLWSISFVLTGSAQAAQIKKVYRGIATFDAAETLQAVPIGGSVDPTKTVVLVTNTQSTNTAYDRSLFFVAQLAGNDTIQIERGGADGTNTASAAWQVIEFAEGVRVQAGISAVDKGSLSKDITVPPLSPAMDITKTVPIIMVRTPMGTNNAGRYQRTHQLFLQPSLATDGTSVTMTLTRLEANSTTGDKAVAVAWQLVEFTTDATVRAGDVCMRVPASAGSQTVTNDGLDPDGGTTNCGTNSSAFSPALNSSSTAMLFFYPMYGSGLNGEDNRIFISGTVSNSTTVSFSRGYAATTASSHVQIKYYVVDWNDGSAALGAGARGSLSSASHPARIGVSAGTDAVDPATIQITTASAHGYQVGDAVILAGCLTNTAANGTYKVSNVPSSTTFEINTFDGDIVEGSGAGAETGSADYVAKFQEVNMTTALTTADIDRMINWTTFSGPNNSNTSTSSSNADDLAHESFLYTKSGSVYLATRRAPDGELAGSTPVTIQYHVYEFPEMTLDSPNGAENLTVGQAVNVNWTAADSVATNDWKLQISTDAPHATWTDLTTANGLGTCGAGGNSDCTGTDLSTGTIQWTVPDQISSTARLRIVDTTSGASLARRSDTSNADFNIRGSLTVTAPNGGETWNIGAASNVTWTKTGSLDYSTVTLKLSLDSGGSFPTTITSLLTPSAQTYSWTPTNSHDGTANRVRAELASDPTYVYDESDADFTVQGSITVVAPNGGESWATQSDEDITWTRTGAFANVKIEYSTNSGGSFPTLIVASTPADPAPVDNAGVYTWTNIPTGTISTFGRVKVSSTSNLNVADESDADFSIVPSIKVTSPDNGTEVWRVGEANNITWDLNGALANVKIEYSKDNFVGDINLIVASTNADPAPVDGSGYYQWTIPDDITATAKVRVSNALDANKYDISDNNFKIRGNITVVSPNGGEVWPVASSQNITWAKDGTLGNVDILYSINGGSSYPNTLATNQAGTSWNWDPIPDAINSNLKVKVRSTTYNTDTEDVSDATFAIKGSFTITSPNGSEQWGAATSNAVTWTYTGTMSTAKIEYDDNSGLNGYASLVVASVAVSDQTYSWTLPSTVGTHYRVRISSNDDATVYDTSNSDFSIRGSVTLTAPNGGQTWVVGTNQNITWTYVGTIANVKLEYSTDGGSNYLAGGLITNSAPVSQAYTWTVADAIGTQLRVRVSDANDSTVNDQSDANFTIKGSLTITAPNGGEAWVVGASNNITWTKTGTIASVKLDYSTNGFSDELQNFAIIGSTPGGLLSYAWTIPDAIGTTLKVRIADLSDLTVKDESDFNFGIKGSVTITAPNGGESWSVGSSHNITWSKTGTLTGNMKLEYSTDNGGSWLVGNLITNSVLASAGTYAWTLPDSPGVQTLVRATQVDDTSVTDTSDGAFSIKGQLILTAPNGGETWVVGEGRDVEWTRIGSIANVRLDYSINSGSTYPNQITASTPASNESYTWTIPDAIGTGLKVKVTDANDSSVNDVSDAVFEIKGSLTVTAPNGGETWVVGNSQNVTWTKTGTIANVMLEYATNAFLDESTTATIVASTPGANLSYAWTIPDAIGNNLKVRVTNLADTTVKDVSDAAFAVKGSLTVGSPNGSEAWIVGESRNIVWSMTGSLQNVKLEYSTNGFSDELQTTLIVASTAAETNPPAGTGSGQYAWTVADAIGTSLKVRVTDVDNSTVTDVSNAVFTIKGSVTVTAPNGGEIWAVLEDHDITWTRTGSFNNVKIEYSTDSGSNFSSVTASTPADPAPVDNAGKFTWTIPDNITIQGRVRVSDFDDATVVDTSDANFKIRGGLAVSTPNGGEKWTVGDSQNISWNKFGTITSTVKLDYTKNGGSNYTSIATGLNVTTASPYAWTVPADTSQTVKIRVMSEADTDTFDLSDANFKIMPKFAVTSPNGGEVWSVASSQTLGWTTQGSATNVRLSYSVDGGNNYATEITSSTSNTGSFSWTVPDAIGTAVRIRVENASDSEAFDDSDANFKIRGVVQVTSPNGGESWNIASAHAVTWNITGSIANVKLEYSTNGFADEGSTATIIASTPADPAPVDGTGTYSWTIPDTPSSSVKVRVSDASDSTASDTSNATFYIRGSLALNAPNGGEAWVVGATQNIQWTRTGSIANVKLEYSNDSGSTWPAGKVIVASTPADPAPADNIGLYSWTIPDDIGTLLRVRVSDAADAAVEDTSNADFTIRGAVTVTSPNGGETWIVGDSQNITWTSSGSFLNVKIEYSTNAFANETQTSTISGSTPNDGTYSWAIPDAIGTALKVRISDASDANVVDVSNAAFEIKGSLTITSPNGSEVWKVGENRSITWNRTGSITTAKLEYSTNGGSSYPNTIIASTDATTGSYAWTVPDAISSALKAQITNTDDTSVKDASDANFEIKGTLTLTSPNGGESWKVNSQHNITWTKTGTQATVKLEYSTDGFADELQNVTIATGVDAVTGTPYVWTIPDAIGSAIKVRVTNEADSAVKDASDTNFKITGSLTLDSPNGSENWAVASVQTVAWTVVGSIANVKLEYSTNSGSTYPNVITSSTAAGAGAYSWTLPDSIGSTRRVKVTDATDSTVSDTSDADFSIIGGFQMTSPNGGEVWTVASGHSVTWNTDGTVANVKLEYSTNGFSDELATTQIVASTTNSGTYSWTIPDAISSTVKIRVSDASNSVAYDLSNGNFKIRGALLVNAPNGGEAWFIGNSQNIQWTRTGSIANVKLEYSSNGFADENQTDVIIASTPADPAPADNIGIYSWTIPDTPGTANKVRVTDASDATVLDTSNANFSIKGQLVMTSPNGGEVWTVGAVNNVTWSKFGAIVNVSLQYSTDSGGTWPGANVITASTAADPAPTDNIGVYSWTIPDEIGTQVRVRVVDTADSSTYDDSNADFKIRGSVTITAPNGGENWIVGTNQNITWNSTGSFSNVKLEYSTNGFSDENQVVSITTSTPNNGSYSWAIPDAIGTTLKVRASDVSDSTVVDTSNANFTIKGALAITSPNGSEVWKVGESRNITWNRSGSITNVKLEYSTNGGSTFPNTIIASTGAASGTYSWTVPDSIGTQLRIKATDVSDSTVSDASDANFEIKGTVTVTSPNGSEVWVVGTQHNVTWTKTGTYAAVTLEYSTNGFTDELQNNTIATGVDAVTGTPYAWTIPDVIGTTLKVRVTNEADAAVKDASDLNFKVTGAFVLTAPNGGENWAVGLNKTVTWTRTGSIANAKLEYSTNSGSTFPNVISASTGAAAEAYIWTIPDVIGSTRRVKISDASDASVYDTSDADFAIMGSFTVTAPNGGEVWTVGSAQSVTWTTDGTVANNKLEYSTNGFSDENQTSVMTASTPNTGSYSWTVPDAISTTVKVRVSDASNANAYDISNGNFKVRGALLLTAPNGGEQWLIGNSENIAWTRTGSIANVKLEYATNGFADESTTATIIASTPADPAPADNAGTYSWAIPDTPGTSNKVRVTDASDSTVLDTSNAVFSIKGQLVMQIPNGSEVWVVGGVNNVQWSKFGSISNVALYFSTDSGGTWPGGNQIVASTAADPAPIDNVGIYSWTIPDQIGTQLRVRVQDADDASTYDDSNNDFKIRGSITITAPNGGENWIVGDTQNITWNHTGSFANVKLEYSTNGFSDESQTVSITTSTPNNGSYSWAIPDAIGTSVKVRASDVSDSTVVDTSNVNFTIKGSLDLTSPDGSEVWKVGENRNITWNRSGSIANVKLEYSTNGGSSYPNTIIASTDAATGTYSWTVPDSIGSQLRVKVSDVLDATVSDTSAANFSIKGTVTVGSPNGGEVWAVGTQHNITWTKTGTYATVALEYSTNGFSDELANTTIATGVDSVTGTPYTWTVPDVIGSTLKVRVTNETDPSVKDTSDLNFKVVGSLTLTAPNGGENWAVGSSKTITWTRVGSIANAKIEYSTNSGTTYPNVIVASTGAAAEAYIWTIPDAIGTTRKVKISDASDASVNDVSDADFTIMGAFAVTAPNGGEVWTVGSAQSVTWNTTGTVSNVKLEYSTNAFSDELQTGVMIASTPNTGTYSWTVADAISALNKVRVSDVNNANAYDLSDAIFKIRGAIIVTAPNGGEQWEIGTSQNITWTLTGSIANVKLEYSTNAFSDELQTAVIVASTAADPAPVDGTGTYAWTIPDSPSTTTKVRVTDASDSTVLDTSNANFALKGRLVMTAPNGGEIWVVAGVNNITWDKFGSISNVALYYSTDSGGTWPGANQIVASTNADPAPIDGHGVYAWTIPDLIGTQVRVRVQDAIDPSTYDDSDADFKIRGSITITAPNGGETWIVGDTQSITWNHTGSFSNAKLEYSTNGFSDELQTSTITGATTNNGSYSWGIPDAIGSSVKVRGSDAGDSTVNDASNANFTIKGALLLTSPNGSEVWKVGESRNITWNRTGSIANVKLEYSTNGGSAYTNTIIASTGAGSGTYAWTVPDSIGSQLRVQVSDVTDSTVNDASDANFQIKGTVTLTSPNGGEVWVVDSHHNITWTKTGTYPTVKLEYSTNGFTDELQNTTIATGVDSVSGTPYDWTVPDIIGSAIKVRVTNETDTTVNDASDLNFKVTGAFTLTAPNGGEEWAVGASQTITWNRTGSIANAKLELSTNGGSTYGTVIQASTGAAAEAYIWTIPDSIGVNRRVRISDASDANVKDTSDADFSILGSFTVTSPNGGEVWTVASAQSIGWSTVGTVANVKLEYSTNAFNDELQTVTIAATAPNTGSYSWTVSDAISALAKIRVSDVNNANAYDISNAVFKIRGALTVNAPNGGEAWLIGNSQNIQWTRTGSIANVKLEYSSNGFSDELQTDVIVASTAADPAPADNIGLYSWTIPDNPGTANKVRVTDASDATVLDTSNANFSIKGQVVLTIPNGGEVWTVGGVNNITWNKFGAISNVKLQYSTDSGDTWPDPANVITVSTAADPAPTDNIGVFSWTIPDAIGTHLRVRVQDTADSSTYDDSNADFKVRGRITITAPNGGEAWVVGTSQNITWTHAGSFPNAKLEYSTNAFADESQTFSITAATPNTDSYAWSIPDAIGSAVRVRGSDAADSTVNDTSDNNFTIKGSLTLTSPNGSEIWKVGESRAVTWNKAGSIANVKLLYSNNGGSTYGFTITNSTDANTGSYTWTVPDTISAQIRVEVSDVTDATVKDSSDANFEIKGTVLLVTPNGGEQWAVNTAHNITWTKTGTYSSVKLEYSTNAFADELQTTTIATGVDSVTGTPYSWTIPDTISSSIKVRITNESDSAVTDKSDNTFKIVGSLTLTAPNGGESWNVGTSQTVSWDRVGSIANVKLEYSTTGAAPYPNLIVSSTSAGAGAYSWTIPDSIGTTRKVKVTDVTDSTVYDESDANFAIVATFNITQPNGGEVWTVASTQNITWTTTGSVANVKLEYSVDNGTDSYGNVIANSTPNNLTYSWQIPDTISTLMKVRVSDVNNANGFDTSNAVFKIRGALTVDAPNGGEAWGIGTNKTVQWTRTGSIANVKLEYSTNGFSDELQTALIVASTPADPAPSDNIGTYSWAIPDVPSTTVKVRVTDVADSTVLDTSNGVFSIKGSLTITAPNGTETGSNSWIVGTPYNITWIKGGAISNVKLQYSTDSGVTWPDPSKVITTSTSAGFLSYTWTIPDDITNKGRVRILDANDNSVNDVSDADFSIKGSLHLTSPDGTEIWTVGDTHAVTWTKTGTIANVKLEYSTDGGSNYTGTITASTAAAAGTFNWTIPDSISTQVRVKVTQTNDSFVTDASDANLEIRGSLTVTSPNGGEVWRVADAQPITWTKTGTIPTVEIDYSINGGSSYPFTIATGVAGSSGSYSWTIPNAITTNARVQVVNESDTQVFDGSDADFKIAGSITVVSPNGGEKWAIGSSKNITWTITGSISSVKLEYSTDGGSTYPNIIAASVNASTGTPYAWTIPDDPTTQGRVKVTNTADTTIFDASNTNFKIQGSVTVTQPNGGEAWNVGETKSIVWSKTGSFANVKIDYSVDGGSTYPNIVSASTPSGNLSYAWTIPDDISTTARVKVTDTNDSEVTDESNADFTIRGVFTVTAPNGGETWRVGQAQNVTWTVTGSVGNVKIEYSTNAFADESQTNLIVATTPAGNLTYAWNIPDAISNTVKVRLTDVDGISLGDVSNGSFSIKGLITLTSPNGGESYGVNSAQNITWNRTGSFSNVKLEYSTNGFSDENETNLITASTPADPAPVDNTGTYAWTVPDAISITVKVRVTDANDAATTDTSNNNFTIRGVLTITAPNGGEKWIVGTAQLITWDRQGSISNVKLQYTTNGSIYTDIILSTPNTGTYAWTIPNSVSTTVKVRIYDVNNNTVTDDSDANFKIQAGFTLSSPNGGEAWLVGSTHSIDWTTFGTVPFVRLDYSTDSGANYSNQISTSTGNSGSYSWVVPDSVSGTVKVRVSDTNDVTANDESNADLRIRASISVVTPNGAEQWRVGRSQNITWGMVGTIPNVKIQYSRDGFFADIQTVAASAPNTGTYAWTIPDSISNVVKVKIIDPNDIGAYDISDANFRITGDFAITSPNGGEKWNVDSDHDITWTHAGTVSDATLEYSTNAGGSWNPITGLTPNNGAYTWTIPDSITAQGRVRISDPNDSTANDISDANFKIRSFFTLGAPNGTEIWTVGDVHAITWTNTGTVSNVKLWYSTDSGATFPNVIIASTSNTGTYNWTVPDSISTTVRVRAGSPTDVDAYDDSDADLKIRGKFVISAPNGNEKWKIAQASNIQWVTTGTIADVKLYYSTNSGSTFPNVIAASTPNGASGATASYSWTVPDDASTMARIRVENIADTTVYDDSDADFKIQGNFILTAPNGGEQWIVGDLHNITWNWGGTIANVKLSYSVDSGSNYSQVIAASAPNGSGGSGSASYSWTVPDDIYSTLRVKIEDPNDAEVFDESNADFKITGSFLITSPAGGERWVTNEVHAITWNTTGTVPTVKLTYSHDNFATSNLITASTANADTYNWTIPDPGINNIPKSTRVRVEDTRDANVNSTSSAFNIDYYYITWDIRDLRTNAPLSDLTVKQTKNTDDTFVQWQETGISANPPRVQPTPYGIWGTTFSKTQYGDLVVVVEANSDQTKKEFMETTVIHIWDANSQIAYNPTTQTLKVTLRLIQDMQLVSGVTRIIYQIFDGAALIGSFKVHDEMTNNLEDPWYDPDANVAIASGAANLFNGNWELVLDAGPSGLNLQPGKVYTTLTKMSIASGGTFKTPNSFDITATYKLQDVQNTINDKLDISLSDATAAIQDNMNTQFTTLSDTVTSKLDATQTAVETKLDTTRDVLVAKMQEQTDTINTAITDFTQKSDEAVYRMEDSITAGAIRLITPESTKVGFQERIQVATDPAASVTADLICPDGTPILSLILPASAVQEGIFSVPVRFDAQTFKCAVAKAVTIVATATIPSKNPANPAFTTSAVRSMFLVTATNDDIIASTSGVANAQKAAEAAKDAVEQMGKALKGNGNIQDSLARLQQSMDRFPSLMKSGEGNINALKASLEEIASKLNGFMGNEGIDMKQLLKQEIGEGMKGVRNKVDRTLATTQIIQKITEQKLGGSDAPVVNSYYETV